LFLIVLTILNITFPISNQAFDRHNSYYTPQKSMSSSLSRIINKTPKTKINKKRLAFF
jgi:hypothetical protein